MRILARIESLKQEVDALSSSLSDLEKQLRTSRLSLQYARLRAWYFACATQLRKPLEQYSLWFLGVILVGSASAAAVIFLLLYLSNVPATVIGIISLLIGLGAAALLAAMMTMPTTANLPAQIDEENSHIQDQREQIATHKTNANSLRQKRASLRGAIRELQQSDQLQRELLLQENWQEMQSAEWENFLVEVFRWLGAQAELNRTGEDPSVNILVRFGALRIAVQARSGEDLVNHKAVRELVVGKAHYGCERAAIITNGRFTKSAIDLAASNSCFLIGRSNFEAFVMGSNLELLESM